jgi:hypothetical protein
MFTDKDDIERELTAAMDVRPGADFEDRLLLAAQSPPSTPMRLVPWLAAAAVLLVALGAWRAAGRTPVEPVSHVMAGLEGGPTPGPAPSQAPAVVLPGPILRPEAERSKRLGIPAGVARSVSHPPSQPEVLVPANQLALLRRFARDLEYGAVQFTEAAEPEAGLRRLVVPEMIINPVPVVALEPSAPSAPKGLQ